MTFNPDNPTEEYDAFDDAMTDEPSRFFGQVSIEAYQAIMAQDASGKWQRPEPYIPDLHGDEGEVNKADDKFFTTQVDISLTPVDPTRKIWTRTVGAKNRKNPEFQRAIRPSIEALAAQIAAIKNLQPGQFNPLKELSGMWVEGEFVPRPSNKPGETWTTLKFTCVFASQEECAAAADEAYNREADDEPTAEVQDEEARKRAVMVDFLPGVWKGAKREAKAKGADAAAEMAAALADNDLLKDHFTVDSPEVQSVMGS